MISGSKPSVSAKPKHYLDQYGGQVEGPVLVPWLYNGQGQDLLHVQL